MTTVERTHFIAAAPDRVWNILADFGSFSSWAPNIDHSCLLTEQQEGVGTVRRVQVGRSTLVETVVNWTPEEALSYEITGLPSVLGRVTNSWNLEAERDGTKVTLTTDIDGGGRLLTRPATSVAGRKFGSASDEMIAGLTRHIDAVEAAS